MCGYAARSGPFGAFRNPGSRLWAVFLIWRSTPFFSPPIWPILLPSLGKGRTPFVLGALMIATCVAMNLLGTSFVGRGSIIFVLALLAPFGFLVWYGFSSSHLGATPAHLTKPDLLGGILIAMWNYMGWDNASTIAGDVKDAHRTYTRAMTISLHLRRFDLCGPDRRRGACRYSLIRLGNRVLGDICRTFRREKLALFMTAAGVVAALSTFNTLVMTLSRLPYAMARDGFLPKVFAKENARGAPWVAIVVCATFWALATVLGFEATVMLDVLLTGLSILLEFAALIALRIKEPNLARPFRISGGLAGVILLSIPPAALIVISCARNHAEQIGPVNDLTLGLFLIVTGSSLLFLWQTPEFNPLACARGMPPLQSIRIQSRI